MGYQTPNIDRIANKGAMFTDSYGQQSCTAGRASLILGQEPFRTGLLTIGMPGDPHGITDWMPTIADALKTQGYATGQFGKNHLGDQDQHLPTNHGFDEFFGNLYHLNAEEEPESYFYPKDPAFKKKYGPRGVIHSYAGGKIEDTGPLNTKRMPTVDEEFLDAAQKFIKKSVKAQQPFFVWFNTTRMHIFTHLKKESVGKSGKGLHADGMVEHDGHVGQLLDLLDELGIDDNTIVVYTTDNGAEIALWPDGAMTMFRGEKGSTWEGGFRIPMAIRWPGAAQTGLTTSAALAGGLPLRAGTILLHELINFYMERYDGRDCTRVQRLSWWSAQVGHIQLQYLSDDEVHAALEALASQPSRFYAGKDAGIYKAKRKPLSPASINRYAASLAAVITWAIKKRIAPKGYIHPCRTIERRREDNERVRFLSDDERSRLLQACQASRWPKLYLLVMMALTTGARKGELLGLRWRDVDLTRRLALCANTKNDDPKSLALTPAVVELLREHEGKEDELVFAWAVRRKRPMPSRAAGMRR